MWPYEVGFISSRFQMRAVWYFLFKNLFSTLGKKSLIFGKSPKSTHFDLMMRCDQTGWPAMNQKVYVERSDPYPSFGILGFRLYPLLGHSSLEKSWSSGSNGKKWVMSPYLLACSWLDSEHIGKYSLVPIIRPRSFIFSQAKSPLSRTNLGGSLIFFWRKFPQGC